jgi:hypothetical protein
VVLPYTEEMVRCVRARKRAHRDRDDAR